MARSDAIGSRPSRTRRTCGRRAPTLAPRRARTDSRSAQRDCADLRPGEGQARCGRGRRRAPPRRRDPWSGSRWVSTTTRPSGSHELGAPRQEQRRDPHRCRCCRRSAERAPQVPSPGRSWNTERQSTGSPWLCASCTAAAEMSIPSARRPAMIAALTSRPGPHPTSSNGPRTSRTMRASTSSAAARNRSTSSRTGACILAEPSARRGTRASAGCGRGHEARARRVGEPRHRSWPGRSQRGSLTRFDTRQAATGEAANPYETGTTAHPNRQHSAADGPSEPILQV